MNLVGVLDVYHSIVKSERKEKEYGLVSVDQKKKNKTNYSVDYYDDV